MYAVYTRVHATNSESLELRRVLVPGISVIYHIQFSVSIKHLQRPIWFKSTINRSFAYSLCWYG